MGRGRYIAATIMDLDVARSGEGQNHIPGIQCGGPSRCQSSMQLYVRSRKCAGRHDTSAFLPLCICICPIALGACRAAGSSYADIPAEVLSTLGKKWVRISCVVQGALLHWISDPQRMSVFGVLEGVRAVVGDPLDHSCIYSLSNRTFRRFSATCSGDPYPAANGMPHIYTQYSTMG
jgi:hypothetical protein